MNTHAMNKPLTPEEAFQITLLVMAEIAKNLLLDRNTTHAKRLYWLEKLDKDIEALNRTYEGYLPEQFQNKAERFYRMIETDIEHLLKGYTTKSRGDGNGATA